MTKLSALGVDALGYSGKQRIHFDEGVPGFGIRVGKKAKTFVLMVGRERTLVTLGRYPAISLKTARTAALRLLAERDTKKHAAVKLRGLEAIERFLTEKHAQTRYETMRQYDRILKIYLKGIHHKLIEDVTTDDITRVTDQLLKDGKAPSANHVLVGAKTFLKWCVKRRLIPHSPAEGLDRPAKETARERVLSDDELRAVWIAADATGYPFGIIVKLLILTGQRRSEIAGLRKEWCSLPSSKDGETATTPAPLAVGGEKTIASICLPATHTKNKRAHTFPIGVIAAHLLTQECRKSEGMLFVSRTSTVSFNGFSKAKALLDEKVEELFADASKKVEPWTLHDLRRTLATNWQRLGISTECIEAYLNHISGTRSGIVGVYQKHKFWDEMVDSVRQYDEWFSLVLQRP